MKRAPVWIVIALLLLLARVRRGRRVQGRRSGRWAGGGQGVKEKVKEGSERGGGLPGARAVWLAKRPRFYSQQHQTSTGLGVGSSQAGPEFKSPRVVRLAGVFGGLERRTSASPPARLASRSPQRAAAPTRAAYRGQQLRRGRTGHRYLLLCLFTSVWILLI